jgi:hypothetical protein
VSDRHGPIFHCGGHGRSYILISRLGDPIKLGKSHSNVLLTNVKLGKSYINVLLTHYQNPALCRVLSIRHLKSSTLGNDRVYRELDSRHKKTLGKDNFTECQTLDEGRLSAKGRQQPSIADGRYLYRVPDFGTRQRSYFAECPASSTRPSILCAVPFLYTRQSIFLFFSFSNQTFVVCCYTV